MTESAIFTAIPAGRLDDGRLKVTVFVTPKLDVTGLAPPGDLVELAAYEAFTNWPETLRDSRFVFDVAGFGQVEGIALEEPIVPDPRVWTALFGDTSVGDAGFQHFEQATVHSYPVAEAAKAVTALYQLIAVASPTDFPAVTRGPLRWAQETLASPTSSGDEVEIGHRRALKRTFQELRRRSDPQGRFFDLDQAVAHFAALGQTVDPGAIALAAAESFYARDDDPLAESTATAPPPDPVPPEFHSFVARCADYPELLRHLGLAVDLSIPDDGAIPEITTIRVLDGANVDPLERLLRPEESRPLTLLHRTDRFWAPAGHDEPDIRDGSLVLEDRSRFSIEQIDPDGAALKVASLIAQLRRTTDDLEASARANNNAPSMTADASSLPALKSAGVLIARRGRAEGLVRQFDRAAQHEQDRTASAPALLDAVDVTRGWRVDISDEASGDREWRSLHARTGVYELIDPDGPALPLPVQPAPDEAYLKAASTSSTGAAPNDDQYLHESVAGWDGWSLAVKRPGRLQTETASVPADEPAEVARTGFPLAARFRVTKGSLPRLRFGRSYRVRVRAVDLSGRSIPGDQLDEAHERDVESTYQRWEPVPSPAIVPLTEYTEGESLNRMVIRSTLGVSVDDYVALARVGALAGHEPSGDVGIVYRSANERNLAAPIAGVQLAETHGMFDAALSGDPAAVAAQFAVAAKEAGSFQTLAGARVVNHADPATATVLDGSKGQALAQGEYIVHDTRSLTLPYLPDPLSRGISFTTLPGDRGASGERSTRLLRWPGDATVWHDRQPVLLRVVEGGAVPVFDAGTRTLVVSLPKATLTTVRVSSFLDAGDLPLMRVWNLIDQSQSPASTSQLQAVQEGRHWMITPYTELTVVHAVEKPLEPPEIVLGPQEQRYPGETFSFLHGTVRNHAASTGRIDIDATWTDPVDDVLADAPGEVVKSAHVADFQLEASETDALIMRTGGPPGGPYGPRHQVRHEFGDTKHRHVEYTATATTRFREYFPPEITDRAELVTSTGPTLAVSVKSSARPDPPDVRYILPTWEWTTEPLDIRAPLAVRRVRSGGGLRVYLGRPWYSSGPHELLGVVLRTQPWITWPRDVDRGVLGTLEARAEADVWARRVLDSAEVNPTDAGASAQLSGLGAGSVDRLVGARSIPARDAVGDARPAPRARTADDRFLRSADTAITAARSADAAARVETRVSEALLTNFLPWFSQTGPEGSRFATRWGADPVFEGEPTVSGPFIHQFPLRTAIGNRVRLSELDDFVTVVGHDPQFDTERRLWFCDLQVEAGAAYTPFVQLALARYQPHSLDGQEISKVVKADFVQVLPRREATFIVDPQRRAIMVTLAGAVGIPAHAQSLPDLASRVMASRYVEVWVERLPAGSTSDLDWVADGERLRLDVRLTLGQLRSESHADVEWAGAIGFPESAAGDELRLRITEYELHRGDALGPIIYPFPRRDRRLVYADTVDLPQP
ncbi:hypothetical protein G5T42_17215 [Microbacterium sp. 4R-513]|uniref:hypothetical protein n=1 Tax=Microbacterium sp. 4R-513 TaxID=2567934 RepID=UPI0013E1B3E6|nr:hypothetical protein [Microbacterium sp. 4R-513]QIG40999.1 hypothetical protein G5T42_17215 [Microbacterium sp. 4R-513]